MGRRRIKLSAQCASQTIVGVHGDATEIGIDYHRGYSYMTAMDASGKICRQERVVLEAAGKIATARRLAMTIYRVLYRMEPYQVYSPGLRSFYPGGLATLGALPLGG